MGRPVLLLVVLALLAPALAVAAQPAKEPVRVITNADLPKTPHVSILGTLKVNTPKDGPEALDAKGIDQEYQFYSLLAAQRAADREREMPSAPTPANDEWGPWVMPTWGYGWGLNTAFFPRRFPCRGQDCCQGHDCRHFDGRFDRRFDAFFDPNFGFVGSAGIHPTDGLLPAPGVNLRRDPLFPPVDGYPGRVGRHMAPNGPVPNTIRGRAIPTHRQPLPQPPPQQHPH